MRRTYASFADPHGRDWVPHDPPPRGWEAHSRPTRYPSPFESASPPETSAARSRPLAPDAPRSDDPDFALKNRLILAAIKAAHHLDNFSDPDSLPIIARLIALLDGLQSALLSLTPRSLPS
ncbi:unnamed protein product [Boreogadus saida]